MNSPHDIIQKLLSQDIEPQDLELMDSEALLRLIQFLFQRTTFPSLEAPEKMNDSFTPEWVSLYYRLSTINAKKNEELSVDEVTWLLFGDKKMESLYLILEIIREHIAQLNALMQILDSSSQYTQNVEELIEMIVKSAEDNKRPDFKAALLLTQGKIEEAKLLSRSIKEIGYLANLKPLGEVQ